MSQFKITTYDTFSTVDGPGIRTVFFLHGCNNRCIYCHNPECFVNSESKSISQEEMLNIYNNNLSYYGENGGFTFSGGEPLLQAEVINEFFQMHHINYVLETSGCVDNDEAFIAIKNAKFVYLDLKFICQEDYRKYVGDTFDRTLKTLSFIEENDIPHIVRQVIVPTINDSLESMREYLNFIRANFKTRQIEFLPFHDMMKEKYRRLNLDYRLEYIHSLDKVWLQEQVNKLKEEYPDFILE